MKTNKYLLKQYANTGAILSPYQVDKLPNGILNSYIRRRILQFRQSKIYVLQDFEEKHAPEAYKIESFKRRYDKGILWATDFLKLDEKRQLDYIALDGQVRGFFDMHLDERIKVVYAKQHLTKQYTNELFKLLPPEYIPEALGRIAELRCNFSIDNYKGLTIDNKKNFLVYNLLSHNHMPQNYFNPKLTPQEVIDDVCMLKLKAKNFLSEREFRTASEEVKLEHLKKCVEAGRPLQQSEYYDLLSQDLRDKFDQMGGELDLT